MRRRVLLGTGAVAALAGAAGGYAAYDYATAPQLTGIDIAANGLIATAEPKIAIGVDNVTRLSVTRLAIDGVNRPDAVRRESDRLVVATGKLADGPHAIEFVADGDGIFGERVARRFEFTVDTKAPDLIVLTPTDRWSPRRAILGRTSPGTPVAVRWSGGEATVTAGTDGLFSVAPELADGVSDLTLEARDEAGNTATETVNLRLDSEPPTIADPAWPRWWKSNSPVLELPVSDRTKLRYRVSIDGQTYRPKIRKDGIEIATHGLAEGQHQVSVAVVDAAGNRASLTRRVGIDSTEVLDANLTYTRGARGKDVVSLTRRLRLEGHYRGRARARFDGRVERAVRSYQKANALPVDGVVRSALITATNGKLIVEKSKFRVYAYRDGRLVATFPVAIGQPAYPSPTGTFVITEKLRNPSWIPPNSPWAKGLEPIPPGPSNPLGTRWIGTSAPAVGLHGTPQDWSIGTAASHGCIRMHISDVERLFELVEVGEPVVFR